MPLRILSSFVLLAVLSACTTNPYTNERQTSKAVKAGAIGAAIGAVAGVLIGDDADERREKALIGAGIGALAGGAVGAYMDVQEAKLREQLQGTGVSVTRIGNDLVLNMPGNVTFDSSRSDLKSGFAPVLDSVVLVLSEYDKTLIDVTGHTDSTGATDYNMQLSERRADSVANYLSAKGVQALRIATQGYGPHYPVASNDNANGRQENRRVELVLKPVQQS